MYSVAGSDTTSTALTVIIWHLLANPKTMQKLTAEICENFNSAEAINYQALRALPYLHAVIEEERWLPNSSIKCDKAAFSPFSYGPRSCLGRNMAYMEMSLTLALLVFRLKLSFANHDNEIQAGFDVEDAFVAIKPSVPVTVKKVTA
ncbi:Cytochrome P450 E-class group I [Penicillium cosmopolitanum]|uniref:Cytochrome P450 E-class group I n=1 Tax=Penicillium cosmopolitanum TaxID=1131564 RepID=A0A9W9V5K3_9EURO|nr:Cytochrome P450 E-class group I [Penicillium cosmopolitanum]KAJ5369552.1 Cytochrome P450 E-class group I [Penicillium cosmopolitanum]